jgi:hypothetical protein
MAHHIPSRSRALATVSGPLTRLAGARQQTGAGDLAHHGCLRYRTRVSHFLEVISTFFNQTALFQELALSSWCCQRVMQTWCLRRSSFRRWIGKVSKQESKTSSLWVREREGERGRESSFWPGLSQTHCYWLFKLQRPI